MPTNVEVKARVSDLDKVRARVEQLSDTPCEATFQEDTFFLTARGRLKLRITHPGSPSLIYYQREDSFGPKPSNYLVHPVSSPESLKAVLGSSLGVRGLVRKQRRLYMVGNTRVHLDDVEGLGTFLELEVMLQRGQTLEYGFGVARDLMAKLGIEDGDLIEGAYLDLLEAGR